MEILNRIAAGKIQAGDLARLQDVGWTMTDASLCGLGQTAASAVMSAIKLWPEMFDESKNKSVTKKVSKTKAKSKTSEEDSCEKVQAENESCQEAEQENCCEEKIVAQDGVKALEVM